MLLQIIESIYNQTYNFKSQLTHIHDVWIHMTYFEPTSLTNYGKLIIKSGPSLVLLEW